jgi:hypothetical protein
MNDLSANPDEAEEDKAEETPPATAEEAPLFRTLPSSKFFTEAL